MNHAALSGSLGQLSLAGDERTGLSPAVAGAGVYSFMSQHQLQQASAREKAYRAHIRGMLAAMMTEPDAQLDARPPQELSLDEEDRLACWLDRSAWLWAVEAMCIKRQQAIKAALRRINEEARQAGERSEPGNVAGVTTAGRNVP